MKNKKKRGLYISFGIVIFLVLAFFGTLYYLTKTINNYNYIEKKWINEKSSSTIDVYIQPSLPAFSYSGVGVYHDYVTALRENTGLNLNVINTDNSEIKFVNKNTIDAEDILVYKDHFVAVGKKDSITVLSDLNYKTIGVINTDTEFIKYYLTDYSDIKIREFGTFSELSGAYEKDQVNYMIIPMFKYINEVLTNQYDIVYHLDGLYSYYCLDLEDKEDNETLNSILSKFYYKYQDRINKKINEYFLSIYYDTMKYSEIEKESITNEDFIVGYINNLPFEGMISNDFTGITSTYLNKFSDMTGVTYKYIAYDDTKDLSSALASNKVDIVYNYYSLTGENYENTRMLGTTDYVVLAHINNNLAVNSLYSLKHTTVDMLGKSNLRYQMASKNLFEFNDYVNIKQLIKNVNENSVIIIEKEVYDYYKDSALKNFSIRYIDNVKLNNSFLLNKNNDAFNRLFDFYLSTLSNSEIMNESVNNVITTLRSNRVVNFLVSNLFYIIVFLLVIGFVLYFLIKKIERMKRINKESRLYYFDTMTNLKNRNYLNDNIDFWNNTKVYPQCLIVVDINNLKALNDKYGHEVGDNQIKAVANILIKTQKDNSEIMRTDGDEFMIYLVGYDEKKICAYVRKLYKDFCDEVPNTEYGVSVGYAMINNEQTTIDDAINDSLGMIHKSKEKK